MSHIQSHWSGDGVEVRSVGPRVVTLALPPEMHDVGALCGELECEYNARIDLEASPTVGVGPIATVWLHADSGDAPVEPSDVDRRPLREDSAGIDADEDENEPDAGASDEGSEKRGGGNLDEQGFPPWIMWAAGKVLMGIAVAAGTAALAQLGGIPGVTPSGASNSKSDL